MTQRRKKILPTQVCLVRRNLRHLESNFSGEAVDRAQILINNTQDMSILRRLATGVSRVVCLLHDHPSFPASVDWATFSLKRAVLEYEAHFINLALKESHGVRARAAKLLGFKSHQRLISLLNRRHKILRDTLTTLAPRRRSIIRTDDARVSRRTKVSSRTVRILHVEDDELVAGMAKEMLEIQGWQVDTCADGNAALDKISGNTDYDLLLVDYDLPGVTGLELVHRARQLAHRSRTPIIVLSATPVEAAALKAGADEFLQKPQGVSSLVETITRLLEAEGGFLSRVVRGG